MKENQNAKFSDSKSFRRENDSLTFGSKETRELNDYRMDASPIAFEAKDRDESSYCKVMDDSSMDNENGTIDSPRKEGQNGHSQQQSGWDKDADSLSSDSYDIDKEQRSPEHESLKTVEEFTDRNGSDSRDPSSPCNGSSDLFETDTRLFTDKNVLECEPPELEVCYDICVDEGRPEKDINVIESYKDGKPGHLFPQPLSDNILFEATEDSLLEFANKNDGRKLVSQGRLESSLDNSFEKETARYCDPEDSVQTGEANCGGTGQAENDSLEEDSDVGGKVPIEDFGEGIKVTPPPDQTPNGKADSENSATLSAGGERGEVAQGSSILYNSNVENESITYNSNSPVPVIVGSGVTENVEEQSAGRGDVHKSANAENLADSVEVQCTSSSVENVQEQSLMTKDGNSSGGSATSVVQCVGREGSSGENAREQSPEHKDATSADFSTDGPVQFPSNESGSSANDVQAVEPNVLKRDQSNLGNVSVLSQLQHDEGETSFSSASLITYSGPIAFSGSLSHRSDGSTTSGKSFAFPILQSEWNSSPVRMAKADRRHFRKHKGWRSGLLCCRF